MNKTLLLIIIEVRGIASMPRGRPAKTKADLTLGLSLEETLENLHTLAQMEVDEKTTIGLLKGEKLVLEGENYPYTEVVWLFPEDHLNFVQNLKPTFSSLLKHLKKIWLKYEKEPENQKIKNTLENIFALSIDAKEKVKAYFSLFGKEVDLTKLEGFGQIEAFWEKQVKPFLGKEAVNWEKKWEKNADSATLDFDFTGLKDWESVKEDRNWELAFLHDENERSFFDFDLLKSIKISSALEAAKKTKEDFILFLENKRAKDLQFSSRHILKVLDQEIEKFYKSRFDLVNNKLAKNLSKAFFALFLSANPKNVIKKNKNCCRYFKDFHRFLRLALKTGEYRQMLFSGKKGLLVQYVSELCYQLFTRIITIREELIGYLHRLKNMGSTKSSEKTSLLEKLEFFQENIREFLQKMPSGPIFKLLQAIYREKWGFDPLLDSSAPAKLYSFEILDKKTMLLHLPSPTVQKQVSQAYIADEFLGFLEGLKNHKEKLLLINLQDRDSYKEAARATALEDLAKKKEYAKNLTIVTLNKDSSFYHQSESFAGKLKQADEFLKVFEEKLFSHNQEDFFLFELNSEMKDFIRNLLTRIHSLFFLEKPTLTADERKDFIELFYHFLTLKLIEEKQPDFVAFVSKDGIDSAASFNASFLAFLKIISKNKWHAKEEDFLSYLFFSPALLVRHRALDTVFFNRSLNCLAHLEERRKELKKTFSDLFKKRFLKDVRIIYF